MPDQTIIASNPVKQLLKNNQFAVGTMVVEIRQPVVLQLLANAGFEAVATRDDWHATDARLKSWWKNQEESFGGGNQS